MRSHLTGAEPEFGPYLLVGSLSTTERATVHRAVDRRHDDRVVALKVFAPALSADPEFRARFRRDAAALSALREPHVVSVHTYGEHAGALFLDMRLVDGRRLTDLRRLPATRAAAIAAQVRDALGGIEEGGLGRRRVEPAEVLVTGTAGHEFVQLVGLGLGRPTLDFLDAADPPRPRTRRRWPVAAALVAVLALVGVGAVIGRARDRPLPPGAVAVLDASAGVSAAATAQAGGRTLVVGVRPDGSVGVWDLGTGAVAGPDLDGPTRSVGTTELDGAPVAVTRDDEQVVHAHRLPDGQAVATVGVPERPDPARLLQGRAAVPAQLDERPVFVSGEPVDPAARLPQYGYRVRALADGAVLGPLVSVPDASLSPTPATAVLDGAPVVVTTSTAGRQDVGDTFEQRELRVFDLATGAAIGSPTRLPAAVTRLRVAMRGGSPVAVLGCTDNLVRVVDVRTGRTTALTGHRQPISGLLVVDTGTRSIVVGESGDVARGTATEIRFWDLATAAPVGPVLRDHPAGGSLLATGRVGGRTVLVAADAPVGAATTSGAVTIWDLAALLGEDTP